MVREEKLEKQMGCMAGFLQMFDRHQIVSGKRLYKPKRLPPSWESSDSTGELEKKDEEKRRMGGAENELWDTESRKVPQGTKSSWKLCKEAPRLSLDSRAREIWNHNNPNPDKLLQRNSTSVVARLMGLDPFSPSDPLLIRSASESRANRPNRPNTDAFHYRYMDAVNFHLKPPKQLHHNNDVNAMRNHVAASNGRAVDKREWNAARNVKSDAQPPSRSTHYRPMGQRKSFFDSAHFFPEPKQTVSMLYDEIERRLKMRGIDEPSKDLETLKQILETLQLKGLLHSNNTRPQSPPIRTGNYNSNFISDESPIVVMRPSMSPIRGGRMGTESPPPRARQVGSRRDCSPSPAVSPRPETDRNARNQIRVRNAGSPTRCEGGLRSPNRRRSVSVEAQQRVSPVQSPRVSSRRTGADQINGRSSTRNRKSTVESVPAEDELSTASGSSISNSTSSHTDTEKSNKVEQYKQGRNILERCDKLLHSIAEMTATTELQQPSPVSVLDSSFYREESSPSPVMKRCCLHFKDQLIDSEDDLWSLPIPPNELKMEEVCDDRDFDYVCDIFQASNYLPEESDVFLLLEKQQNLKGKDTSGVSKLQRKLIFDTINEIVNRKRKLPPWKVSTNSKKSGIGQQAFSLQQIWSEFQRIRERDVSDDLFEIICGVLKKDLAGDAITGWGDCPIEMSEAVLDIERLIFKDLISETIRDLAAFAGNCNQYSSLRRKLVF